MTRTQFLGMAMLLVSMSGCAQHAGTDYITPAGFSSQKTEHAQVIRGIAAQDAAKVFATRGQSYSASNPDDYRITPLDVLEVSVLGAQD